MKFGTKNNLKAATLSLTLPSSLLFLAWYLFSLVRENKIHPLLAIGILLFYLASTIVAISRFLFKSEKEKK